ncbi:zinc finger protein 106 isoform X2 [Channa argus]|uniref:zinc finger protein 106 isoform X2 n=1 Tax=Channa argus TaxID=215402 RepID=UPI00351FA9CD
MAKGETLQKKVGKKPIKKNNNAQPTWKAKRIYCILCRKYYTRHEAQEHIHGMLHHRELETVLGKNSFHECQACKASSMHLNEYAQHISTPQHMAKLKSLMSKNVKPISLHKTLSTETIKQILERNKTLKKEEKKAVKKKKKKLKQIAGQKRAEMLQQTTSKNTVASSQVNTSTQMQETHQRGSNSAIVQNKENKVTGLQRGFHQRGVYFQNQSGRVVGLSGEPTGRTWHQPNVRDQFTHSTHQLNYADDFSVNSQCINVKAESSQTNRNLKRSYNTQRCSTNIPEQTSWPAISQYDHYNRQYSTEMDKDFTSDHLPQNGSIIFDDNYNESIRSSQPRQENAHCSANPASTNKLVSAPPIRDVDVTAMLRQIRRALGVREPCRADREAKKQNSEATVRVGGAEREPPTGASFKDHTTSAVTTSVQSPDVNSPAPAAHSVVWASNIAHDKPQQTACKRTQDRPQHCHQGSVVSGGLPNSREAQGVLNNTTSLPQHLGKTTSPEPKLTISRRVRIAHEQGRALGGKEAGPKPTLNKMLGLSGARSRLSWSEMYEGMKRKKQDSIKGMPRFGIELPSPSTVRESSAQPQENDVPLSEGFHWESVPDTPKGPHLTLPPPPQDPTHLDTRTETQSECLQEPLQQSAAAQQEGSSCTVTAASVKVEPNLKIESWGLREKSSTRKRKCSTGTDEGVSDKEPSGKKKKIKSNRDQNQMDQLLAVSLREDELSLSLQDLDKSLLEARNALQAAYTEVQRLLLLRQQFIAEVNSLRAKRIEILQGMQGYSEAFSRTEKAPAPTVGVASAQASLSPLSFCVANQQPPATTLTSSFTQTHQTPIALSAVSVKQEMHQPPPAVQTNQFTQAVLSNTDAPQVPLNQPVALFPPDLLPTLLLRPSQLAAPTTAAAISMNILPSAEPSAKPQEQDAKEGLKEPTDSDSDEKTGGNLSKEQVKRKEMVADKSVPERHKTSSAAAPDNNDGSESDDSIEMMEPSYPVIIDIDESDNEDHETISDAHVNQESPRTSAKMDFSTTGTQTSQRTDEDRKVPLSALPVKDASITAELVENEKPSLGAFKNHSGPVHGLQIHDGLLYTCSGDNTTRAYSLVTREMQAVFEGHTNKVNCLLVSSPSNMPARLYTGSSDQTIRCYSIKSKKCLEQLSLPDRVLCLHIAWNVLYAGLANGSVASYDLKTLKQLDVFECHGPRGVSCLATAQEGARRVLLVGSYDSTISVRDAKSGLLLRSLEGHTKTVLCMKVVNDLVFSGSSDTSVHAHNVHTGELVRIYKGHDHAVTSIVILGKVMVTACLDKLVRVYELQSHDRLQVYGGHSDMVMCMAIHKSVIYTGCYDGTVQAVKLNLMKNCRCWWQNCSLIFGVAEHLVQHLVGDHSNPNLQTVRCRWRGCNTFFATQQAVCQELPEHMKSHVENENRMQS